MTNQRVGLKQIMCLRALLQRDFVLGNLKFNPYDGEITYDREGCNFIITQQGEIQKWAEVTSWQRVYVSDYREEGYLAGYRETP